MRRGAAPCGARLLLLASLPALAGWCGCGWSARGEVVTAETAPAPAFDPRLRTDVAARLGDAATLECTVLHLANKSVSWVRSRDLQILTYGEQVFTADSRVSLAARAGAGAAAGGASHSHGSLALTIARLRSTDAGRYECQLNTEPKMSLFFNLSVVDEAAPAMLVEVLGPGVVEGRVDGAATLGCVARLEPAPRALPPPPLDVRWLHDGRPVGLETGRGGVSLQTERWAARVESRLTLAGLRRGDAGAYRCRATGAGGAEAELRLYVRGDNDDYPEVMEAMQRDQTAAGGGARRGGGGGGGGGGALRLVALLLALGALV